VDGRTDLFDDELLRSYLTAWSGQPSWQALFQKWGIRLVLIEPEAPLASVLQSVGWRVLYQDALAVVLVPPDSAGESQVVQMLVHPPNSR